MKRQLFIPQSSRPSARQIATDLFVKRVGKPEPKKQSLCNCRKGDQGIHKNEDCPVHGEEVREALAKRLQKGTRNGTCNISVCNNSPAIHYNRVMEKYYCTSCARKLNRNMTHDGRALCSWPKPEHVDRETDMLLPDAPVDYFPEAGR